MTMNEWLEGEENSGSWVPGDVTSRLEECLRELWSVENLTQEFNGDYQFAWGAESCWVRVLGDDSHNVAVFGNVLLGVEQTYELLFELNEMNSRTRMAHVYWLDGAVVACVQFDWNDIEVEHLRSAVNSVAYTCAELGPAMAIMHGGVSMSAGTPYRPAIASGDADD